MKIMLRYIRLAVILSVACVLLTTEITSASNYTMTIDDSGITRNQTFIFEEYNVGPGFYKEYPIEVNNRSSKSIDISLHDIIEDSSSTITASELDLTFSKTKDNQDGGASPLSIDKTLTCLAPNTTDQFYINAGLDRSYGNAYQQRIFSATFTFEATEGKCRQRIGLPNTGEDRSAYFVLICLILFFTIATIISLIFFLASRRRRDDR